MSGSAENVRINGQRILQKKIIKFQLRKTAQNSLKSNTRRSFKELDRISFQNTPHFRSNFLFMNQPTRIFISSTILYKFHNKYYKINIFGEMGKNTVRVIAVILRPINLQQSTKRWKLNSFRNLFTQHLFKGLFNQQIHLVGKEYN